MRLSLLLMGTPMVPGRLAKEFGTHVFRFPSPGGPGRARNCGAAQARGEVLLFIDADVTVPPQAIEMVIGAFRREPQIDALFGSYDDEPAEPNFLSQYRNLLHHYVHQHGREDASTFWGACGPSAVTYFCPLVGSTKGMQDPRLKTSNWATASKKAGARQVVQISPSEAFETMEFCFDVAGRFFSEGAPMD